MDFGGTLQVAQNFTTDAERLKQAVRNLKLLRRRRPMQGPRARSRCKRCRRVSRKLGNVQADFGARTLLLALRDMAKGLASVPGRKTLVLLSAGFPLNPADPNLPEQMSELTAAIDSCNKANVAIYPIDVRGLTTPISAAPELQIFPDASARSPGKCDA